MGAGASSLSASKYISLYEEKKNDMGDEELLKFFSELTRLGVKLSYLREFMDKNAERNFATLSLVAVCTDFVTPVCQQAGQSYCDYLVGRGGWMASKVGPASCFVSVSWKCMYADVVDALEAHLGEESDPFVYLDLFCMSNWSVPSVEEHLQVLSQFDRVVHIVHPFENPVTSARCLIDIYFANHLEVCMVPAEKKKFFASIARGHHKPCLNYLHHLDVSKCNTFRGKSHDSESLLLLWKKQEHSAMTDEEVVIKVNARVRERYLNEWILKAYNLAIDGVEDIEDVGGVDREHIDLSWSDHKKLSRLESLSLLLRDVNRLHDSLEVRMKCVEVSAKVYGENSPLMGATWMNVAIIQEMMSDFPKALESFQRSLGLYLQEAGARQAKAEDVIHEVKEKRRGIDEAAKEKAKHEHNLNKLPLGPVYYHIACVFEKLGEYKEAMLHYKKALEYSEKHASAGGSHHLTSQRRHHAKMSGPITEEDMPPHCLHGHIANVYLHMRDLDAALTHLEVEKQALFKLLGENDASLAVVYSNMCTALQRRDKDGDMATAKEYLRMALEVAPNAQAELSLRVIFKEEEAMRMAKEIEAEEAAEDAADDL